MSIGRIPFTMISPPNPTGAEVLRQALATVIYAESRAMFLCWAKVAGWDPIAHAWSAIRRVLDEGLVPGVPAFLERSYAILREESQLALEPALRRAGPSPYDTPIGGGQIGTFHGLEETNHEAARVAMFHRHEDPRLISIAVRMADFARRFSAGSAQA